MLDLGIANAPSAEAGIPADMAELLQVMRGGSERLSAVSMQLNEDVFSQTVEGMRYQTEAFLDKQESSRITSSIMSSFDILKTMLQGIQ